MPRFRIDGLKDVQRRLKGLAPKVRRKVIRRAMRAALGPVRDAVRADAPKRSGKLAAAAKVRAGARARGAIAVEVRVGAGDFQGETFYGGMVEYGTREQKAQHFMLRAFDRTKGEAQERTIAEILGGIEREAAAGG